jgi:DNA recombination protein RmuC
MEAILFILVGAAAGAAIVYFMLKSKQASAESSVAMFENNVSDLKAELAEERNRTKQYSNELATSRAELSHFQEKLQTQKEEIEQLQQKFAMQFENLANKILDEKSSKFSELNKENIKNILDPLREKIADFEKKVETNSKENITINAALREQILNLTQLNEQMSREAMNLTKALKGDSKMQGNWGELVLERVLEKSGLEKGREYDVQQSFTTEEGNRLMPDVIIHMPDGKKMIIDSKVSLTAYERFVNAEDELEKAKFLKDHVNSIERHVEMLSAKNYHDLYKIESPNFVLLFIPIEPAFAVALSQEAKLYNKAFDKNIVIVTPATLLATLRTIDSMWQNEKQQRNALKIAEEAGKLYDQFVNLTDDLLKLGNQFKTAQGTYESTMRKLTGKGNLLGKVENLKKLGVKANKVQNPQLLDRIEDDLEEEPEIE